MRLEGFEDFEEIGRGGFSTVYRARQLRPDRTVAIKILDLGVRGRNERAAFERECNLSARLGDHPHALAVYEVGFDRDGHPYLVLPYCEGGSLNDRLGRDEDLDVAEAVKIVVRVASALSAAHAAGVLHRDVKPANILIDAYGEPRLADFGLARLAEQAEGEHSLVMYTPLYAAPEQRLDEPVDERTDQYGLAVTLFALLEGRPPHPDSARNEGAARLHRILTDGPPPLRRPDVPMALRKVVSRGMATSPADRFESVDAFARAASLAAGTPLSLASIPSTFDGSLTVEKNPSPQLPEPRRRGHWWIVAMAVGASLVLVSAAALLTRPRSANPPGAVAATSSSVVGTTATLDATAAPKIDVGPEYAPQNPTLGEFPGGTVAFSWLPPSATINGVASPGVPYFSAGGTAPMEPLPSQGAGSWSGASPAGTGCFYAVAVYTVKTGGHLRVPSKASSYRGPPCPDVAPSFTP